MPIPTKPHPAEDWVTQKPPARGGNSTPSKTKRLTLDIPADLHQQLKRRAVDEDTTMVRLVQGWIEEQVRR